MTILQENTHEKLGKPPSFIFYLQFCSTITILRKISNVIPFSTNFENTCNFTGKTRSIDWKRAGKAFTSPTLLLSCCHGNPNCRFMPRISALNIDISRELPCVAEGGSDFGYMATLIFSLTSTDSTFRLLSESFCQWLLFSA